jgi:hypothetical protein
MCKFFSLCSEPLSGKILFFDEKIRKALSKKNEHHYQYDSHTSIASYFGFPGEKEDKLNKYEYDIFQKKLVIDKRNSKDDFEKVQQFCNNYDFNKILKTSLFSLDLHSLTSAVGLILPKKIGGCLNLGSLTSAVGLILPKKIGGYLDLGSLTSAEGLKLPEKIGGYLSLSGLTNAEGLTMPESVGGSLYLRSLTSAVGLILPKKIGGCLDLGSLTSAEGLKLPEKIGGYLDLGSLPANEQIKIRAKYKN